MITKFIKMTKEEAETLGPGDIISGPWVPKERTIVKCEIRHDHLHWSENIHYPDQLIHSWEYNAITLVSKGIPQIINTYQIY